MSLWLMSRQLRVRSCPISRGIWRVGGGGGGEREGDGGKVGGKEGGREGGVEGYIVNTCTCMCTYMQLQASLMNNLPTGKSIQDDVTCTVGDQSN